MTQDRRTGRSHHEQLRYDYLMTRFHYLSEKEKEELAYLSRKDEAIGQEPSSSPHPDWQADTVRPQVVTEQEKLQTNFLRKTKKKKKRWKRVFRVVLLLMILSLTVMLGLFVKGLFAVNSSQEDLQPASRQYFSGQSTADGVNILILGSDRRPIEGDEDARTDSIMVLNIGNNSGQPKLVSFMRDTLVNIDGYSSWGLADHKLNASFSLGQQEGNQGAELVRQTLKNNFDLDIQYYMMVDFETFAIAIDTLFPEGVEIDAQFSTVDGEVVDSVEVPDDLGFSSGGELYQTIEVGQQAMDGKTLLNYARFRTDDSGDFGRTQRQQQVLSAIVSQIKDPTKLFTGSEALGKVYALTSTNIDFPFIIKNGLTTLLDSRKGIEQVTIPAQGDWEDSYDVYGGQGLLIDFEAYQQELADLGLR